MRAGLKRNDEKDAGGYPGGSTILRASRQFIPGVLESRSPAERREQEKEFSDRDWQREKQKHHAFLRRNRSMEFAHDGSCVARLKLIAWISPHFR